MDDGKVIGDIRRIARGLQSEGDRLRYRSDKLKERSLELIRLANSMVEAQNPTEIPLKSMDSSKSEQLDPTVYN